MLKKFAITGYVIDRKRMENGTFLDEDYFERLLEEIREIRLRNAGSAKKQLISMQQA